MTKRHTTTKAAAATPRRSLHPCVTPMFLNLGPVTFENVVRVEPTTGNVDLRDAFDAAFGKAQAAHVIRTFGRDLFESSETVDAHVRRGLDCTHFTKYKVARQHATGGGGGRARIAASPRAVVLLLREGFGTKTATRAAIVANAIESNAESFSFLPVS